MSGRDRNRSPRRDDRRDRDRRRQRSFSPPRRRRSPPRGDRYRDDEHYDRGHGGRYEDDYRRGGGRNRGRSPPERGGSPGAPMSYKDFMRKLDDRITPADAEREYQEYLTRHWGSDARREFEEKKDLAWMRAKYDPREVAKRKEDRAAKTADLAKDFVAEVLDGKLDPDAEDFNQGTGPDGPKPAVPKPEDAEMDEAVKEEDTAEVKEEDDDEEQEKEDDGDDKAEGEEEKEGMEEEEKKEKEGEEEEDEEEKQRKQQEKKKAKEEDDKAKAAKEAAAEAAKWAPAAAWDEAQVLEDLKLAQKLAQKLDSECGIEKNPLAPKPGEPKEEKPEEDAEKEDEEMEEAEPAFVPSGPLAHLDLLLSYLWKVHEVDYYAGEEVVAELLPEGASKPEHRKLRGPKPEETDDGVALSPTVAEFGESMQKAWQPRIEGSSPFDKLLRTEWVEKQVGDWVENQVTKIDDAKFGCKLSTKMFVAKEFVYKHVRGKHTHLLDAERQKILDEVFMKNFLESEEQQAAARERTEGPGGQFFGSGPPGPMRRTGGRGGGFGGGRHGPMRGRGGYRGGGRGGRGYGGGGYGGGDGMGPHGGPMMGGGMGPQVLVPAPGAGPLGPFIMAQGPMGPPMAMPMPMMGGGGGGRGGYHDLDNPRNNRAVLDYGDL